MWIANMGPRAAFGMFGVPVCRNSDSSKISMSVPFWRPSSVGISESNVTSARGREASARCSARPGHGLPGPTHRNESRGSQGIWSTSCLRRRLYKALRGGGNRPELIPGSVNFLGGADSPGQSKASERGLEDLEEGTLKCGAP